jgi:hypothetical protein
MTMAIKTSLPIFAAALLALGLSGGLARAAKPSNLVPAQAAFANAGGDRILSDGQGTYVDGMSGVSCDFHDPALGGSGDLTFHTSSPGSGQNTRAMMFLFPGTQAVTGCPFDGLSGMLPASSQSASLTVRGIYQMGYPGVTEAHRAIFFLTEGTLDYSSPAVTGYCSTPVQVTRLDATHWTITATSAPTAAGAGDIAVLRQPLRGNNVLTRYWEMPFTLYASTLP